MKTTLTALLTILISTSITFASPGVQGYAVSKQRQKQIEKIKEQSDKSREKLIRILDRAISKLEKSPSKDNLVSKRNKIKKVFVKNLNKQVADARGLLNDSNKFIIAFNNSKALNPDLTQYEFKQGIMSFTDERNVENAILDFESQIASEQSFATYMKDYKEALIGNKIAPFLAKSSKSQKGRSIASSMTFTGYSAIGALAILSVGTVTAGIYLATISTLILLSAAVPLFLVGAVALGAMGILMLLGNINFC